MRILFDQGPPAPLHAFLTGHSVRTAKAQGLATFTNGDLLTAAQDAGFDVLVTTDKNIRYQQNLTSRTIAIVVLETAQWPILRSHVAHVVAAVQAAGPVATLKSTCLNADC